MHYEILDRNLDQKKKKKDLLDNYRTVNNICRLVNRVIVMLISWL